MVPDPSRRYSLRLAGTALLAGLAGCSGLGGSNDPDAGTDSYGVLVRNALDESHEVSVVAKTYDGEVALEETLTLDAGERREWDEVLTEAQRYLVRAELPHQHMDGRFDTGRTSVKVGSENAPATPNVEVLVRPEELEGWDHPLHAVEVSL